MIKSNKLPFMSIAICSLNGEATIKRAIESILAQNYPKDRYEIIAVSDGSTDNTSKIMGSFKQVKLINLKKNIGIPAARNLSLKAAKGDIYVSFDDDFVASPDWLRNIAQGYSLPKVAGVGGYLVDLEPKEGLIQNYISISGQGIPPKSSEKLKWAPIINKLISYVTNGLRRTEAHPGEYSEVNELYGANCSFPIEVLRGVGGWRESMFWIEDRDLSLRIRQKYPERHFYVMHEAKIMNTTEDSIKRYLLRPFKRGNVNYKFHKENAMTPPLFPSPFIMAGMLAISLIIYPVSILAVAILLPQVLYFWWPVHAFKQKKTIILAFPYFQLIEEAMVLAGLLRGYIHYMRCQDADT